MSSPKKISKILFFSLVLALSGHLLLASAQGQAPNPPQSPQSTSFICAVYISGNGCSNCAVTDPYLFTQLTARYPNLVIIDYEIYKQRLLNTEIKNKYFKTYLGTRSPGIPFLAFGQGRFSVGHFEVLKAEEKFLQSISSNACPMPDGSAKAFEELDLAKLEGQAKIWTKNRVLITGQDKKGDNQVLHNILALPDIKAGLQGTTFEKIKPAPVEISLGKIQFENAIQLDGWRLEYNGAPLAASSDLGQKVSQIIAVLFILLILVGIAFTFFEIVRTPKGPRIRFRLGVKIKDCLTIGISVFGLLLFFALAKNVSPDFLQKTGYSMPLGLFTVLIALVDSVNPCNMFVLTCLLALMVSTSSSRARLYVVGFCFVFVTFLFYFLFMAAWLNVFKYMGFITPLRIALALVALVAGTINCKEILFFKKGISLTIPEDQKGPLFKKMRDLRSNVEKGSMLLLLGSAVSLAIFSSVIELLCTAGFPIIYTGILIGKGLEKTFSYYLYLIFYNIVYVLPLVAIVIVVIRTFKAAHITQRQVEIIKYVGGVLMILLGLILLLNPSLLGLAVK